MTTPQVVETSVTVNNNSPIQNYVHLDDQTQPTFEKPLNKYLYIIPASNKKAFIRLRGELMRYTRNSSTFKAFSDTREKFWKRLQSRAVTQLGFLLPLFREVKYSNRTKWLSRKRNSRNSRIVVFKSTFSCSHANNRVIQRYLPDLDCIVIYKST